ncbi:hypothetical protein [Aeromicrobium sp.]|uniref:hypothetical protein n=1 Tax=Aeromicrobium sp. TaxID=1871063 RepID=UPI0025BCA68B|nr:hypothetical protein [Aeromicrobium sp.]MCK5891274.1 hypothetical protein [Aeromicrobium sp.]
MGTGLARVIGDSRYFFADDTQAGATGVWYVQGQRLLDGGVTLLDPGSWQGGNYLAEGQWGLFSPILWAVSLGSTVTDDLVLLAIAAKVPFLAVMAAGVFLLARSFGSSPAWAAVAGFTVTTAGQTTYVDATSWITGLQGAALLPWVWWGLRRHLVHGKGPGAYFVSAGLMITLGYLAPVLMLVLLFAALLGESILRREPRTRAVRILLLGLYSGLLSLLVFLPALLSAQVTSREGGIVNRMLLTTDLGDLAVGSLATALPTISWFNGVLAPSPVAYLGWFLPLLVVLLLRYWRTVPPSVAVLTVGALFLLLAPSDLGPLRFPLRMQPYVVLGLGLLFAVLATRAAVDRSWSVVERRRVRLLLGLAVGLAVSAVPANADWVLVGAALQAIVQELVMRAWSADRPAGSRLRVPAVAMALGVGLSAITMVQAPVSPMPDHGLPGSIDAYPEVAAAGQHGIVTVGDFHALKDSGGFDEAVFANAWYLTGWDSLSVYTVLRFPALADQFCAGFRGETCAAAYDALVAPGDGGRPPLADDLLVNTIVVVRDGATTRPVPPTGWSLEVGDATWIVRRDAPTQRAGSVLRTTGAEVSVVRRSDSEIVLRVDDVDASGGQVVLSRLDWPGYRVTGPARLTDPDRGFLLTLDVAPGSTGREIVVRFRPPGWPLEIGSGLAAVVLALGWTAAAAIGRRRVRAEASVVATTRPEADVAP